MSGLLFLLGALCAGALLCMLSSKRVRHIPLPPGPPGGWSFDAKMAPYASYQTLETLVQEYGPVVTLRSGGSPVIMIGRRQEAIELMEREGALLADRPQWTAGGMVSGGMRILLLNADKRFRKLRRALHSHLQVNAISEYEPLQMRAGRDMIFDILKDPGNHFCHSRRFAASLILSLTYGKTAPTSANDPDVIAIHRGLQRIGVTIQPGAYMADKYPFLRYLPFYGRDLRAWHGEELSLFRRQLNSVRKDMADVGACFGRYLIEHQKDLELTTDEMAYLAGTMFGAGSGATASSISFVIMAAALFPSAQSVAQMQLDRVVGKDRAPFLSDREFLPQVTAFVLEAFRWRPPAGSGFPHRASKDIIWNDYCIPKGSTVAGNHWSICRDPLFFEEPDDFDPSRWLDSQGHLKDLSFFNYGFGRRVCPGQHLADRSVFLCTALLLWAFRISSNPSAPIDMADFTGGVHITPKDFSACFQPRIPDLEDTLAHYL